MRKAIRILTLATALLSLPLHAQTTPYGIEPWYAQTLWSTGHRDGSNSDRVPVVMTQRSHIGQHLLQGYPVFWPPTAGPEGHYYVTSGKGQGYGNLHAFDGEGKLLWSSAPQRSPDDLDGWAIINAPVVAANGDLYVGDQNQLWAFHPDGRVKWVSKLNQYGVSYGFITVILTRHGYVGGISANGKVVMLRAADGALALPVLSLPGGAGPAPEDTPPGDLWKNLMDPALKPLMFNLIQGWAMQVANTPAIDPDSGRIFITAYGVKPGTGLLYGIDVLADRIAVAFAAPMGKGSGTSPALSRDGRQIYAMDELGHMTAIDAHSGKQRWQRSDKHGGGGASPTVGHDETIYTLYNDYILAFNYDGSLKFERSYNDLCASRIEAPDGLWSLLLSPPMAYLDSIFTVDASNTGWMNVVCGYDLKLLPKKSERTRVPVPRRSLVVAVDLDNGAIKGKPLSIPETSEGFIMPLANGNQVVTLSGAISSIFYHSFNRLLPKRFEVPFEPTAGFLLLEPDSLSELLGLGLDWMGREQEKASRSYAGSPHDAWLQLRLIRPQLDSSLRVLNKARQKQDIASPIADTIVGALQSVAQELDQTERERSLTRPALDRISRQLARARQALTAGGR